MSACPLPDDSEKLVYPAVPATKTAGNPDPIAESCGTADSNVTTTPGGGPPTVITQTTHCAGPVGPQGPAGPPGDCGLGYEERGQWALLEEYYNQEENPGLGFDYHCNASTVLHNGATYKCVYGHIADADSEPGVGVDWEYYWLPMALTGDPLEEDDWSILGLAKNFWDWITDVPNWGWGDWLKLIAGAAVVGWGVTKVMDMMEADGEGDGFAGSKFNGTPSYSGAAVDATLPKIIEDLCDNMPFTVDVSLLTAHELSFAITNPLPKRNILAQLAIVYAFSIVPSGSTVRFVPWDQPAVKTLEWDDLGFGITDSSTSRYSVKRKQGVDLPRKVTIKFVDRDLNYQDNTAPYEIAAYPDGQEVNLQVPFVMSYDEARAVAERALMLAHLEATSYKYTISFAEHMELEPGDNINTPLGLHRIANVNIRSDGGMEITAVDASFIAEMSVPSGTGTPVLPDSTNTPDVIGYSTAIVIDLPPINSEDTEGRVFAAVHGYGLAGWTGAGIYQSTDGGGSYDLVATSRQEATVGMVESAIAAPTDYHLWDDDTVITVELKTNELLSTSDSVIYEGVKNHALIGSEMIAFGNVTLVGTSVRGNPLYELTHLLRGLQGTEWAIDDHIDTELFILIDNALVKIPYPIDERGHPRSYKIVTIGSDTSKGDVQVAEPFGINLVPWTVSHPGAEKLGSTEDWLIQWAERARFAGDEIQDYNISPHDFDWAGWTLAILDPADHDIEIRVEHITAPNFTYTEAMQIEDFGSAQGCITVKVIAMSSIVGGGYSNIFSCT